MRLIDIEKEIKVLVEEDVNNPEIFILLNKLIYLYFKRTKYLNSDQESKEAAITFAEDLYMKLLRGEPIYSYLGYINKAKMGYVRKYRKATQSELIDTSNNASLEDAVIRLFAASSLGLAEDFHKVDLFDTFNSLPDEILGILDKSSRYMEYTSTFMNIYISILLSLMNPEFEYVLVFLDEFELNYFKLLLSRIKVALVDDIHISKVEDFINNINRTTEFFYNDGEDYD